LCEIAGIFRSKCGQLLFNCLSNAEAVFRIEPVVRITERVKIRLYWSGRPGQLSLERLDLRFKDANALFESQESGIRRLQTCAQTGS
jgi:hypothetical protein